MNSTRKVTLVRTSRTLAVSTIAGLLLASFAQVANAEGRYGTEQKVREFTSNSQQSHAISDFAQRMKERYNINIDQSEYQVQADSTGISILPRPDSEIAKKYNSAGQSAAPKKSPAAADPNTFAGPTFNVKPPSLQEINSAKKLKPASTQAEPNWFPTECWSRAYMKFFGLDEDLAWADSCHVLGWLPPTNGRGNYMYRMWSTCSTTPEATGKVTLTECGVQDLITTPNAAWVDWAPRADAQIGTCGTFGYAITIGAITGSWSFPACDTIKIDKHNPDVYFKSWWSGRASGKNRSTEMAISFTVPETVGVSGDPRISTSVEICRPGPLGDPCEDTQ
ncbi:hypothetical protein [Amycolatopsis sp. NPDC051372]|uniref:hypothetical protein n=1 Tax=Amycolatopsis sp. NPDC051372 TaxID=3155669 RepID=UPI00341C7078